MSQLDFYDAELRRHNKHLRAAADVHPGDRVLDVGCGTGLTTRQAARAAANGSALGVDVSAPMLERARQLSAEEGLKNVSFELGDAQTHPFPPAHFDLCISRFGTMFFADPRAAFTNIGRALGPKSRLVMLVWQERDDNEWAVAVRQALTPDATTHQPPAGDADPFSLADPATTRDLLSEAGFADIAFTPIHEPVYYGPDVDTAYANVLALKEPRELLASLDAPQAKNARRRLRATLDAHHTGDGVYFDSQAWIVTARRSG